MNVRTEPNHETGAPARSRTGHVTSPSAVFHVTVQRLVQPSLSSNIGFDASHENGTSSSFQAQRWDHSSPPAPVAGTAPRATR
ncbi:hypothetical protein FHR32_000257 [Streptosporangium album]|uniref:Uncharacterized protein n=1 Tax=Streptosporangium album TaxID=47479 RepID=A0A7W7W665_9ACTN|nr:hypothetical protein [Streptosporangium album]MBB4935952.1 hypothetical protein [Streptosporangium album]